MERSGAISPLGIDRNQAVLVCLEDVRELPGVRYDGVGVMSFR